MSDIDIRALEYPFDAAQIIRNVRKLKKLLLAKGQFSVEKRIAVLGGSTTHDIVAVLDLFLLKQGIRCEFYESEYGKYWEDVMFGNEALAAFKPDLIFIHTTRHNIERFPEMTDTREQAEALLQRQYGHFTALWDKIAQTYRCPVIQNNFEPMPYRLLGNRDCCDHRGRTHFINRLNAKFCDYASEHDGFYLNDINYVASSYGVDRWSDLNCWYLYKYAMSITAIPAFAFNLANIIKAIYGKNKKALALDLDNTLWGGVIGDDGVGGIEIGHETAAAEAYTAFQQYLLSIRNTGVLLNINSKNDMENALLGLSHPQTTLKKDDFLVIKANWENKDKNLVDIARELNIGADSLVFVDDNPAERDIVRTNVPGAAVPEMDKVGDFIRVIDRSGFFEPISITGDDLQRNAMYKSNLTRAQDEAEYADYADYLKSLAMTAEVGSFSEMYLQRITQLINKTNQFNLTTKRYTLEDVRAIMNDRDYMTLYGRLTDKYGDNGIVSCMIGHMDRTLGIMNIDLWIMSCRVLKRGMEALMLNAFVERAAQIGAAEIRGHYFKTEKNRMVAELYGQMGFELTGQRGEDTEWRLKTCDYRANAHEIALSPNA